MIEKTEQQVTMTQLLEILNQLNTNRTNPEGSSNQAINLSDKLNHQNHTKGSKLMYLAISGRGKLNHIIASSPSPNDPGYLKWTQQDATVISQIIENIETKLVNQLLDYSTARDLWNEIESLYSSGKNELQVFDLTVKANTMRQGTETIEAFYRKMNPNQRKQYNNIVYKAQRKAYRSLG